MTTKFGGMKRLTAIASITALVTLTAACGGGSNDNKASGSESPAATTSAAATESAAASEQPVEDVSITVWDKPHSDDPSKADIEANFAAFDAKYPHIKVTHVEQTKGKEREQFLTAVAGGEQPDLIRISYPEMAAYIQQGVAADITDLWNAKEDKDKYLPGSLQSATVDGKIYGVPNDMYVTGMIYNKKLFIEAGLDPLKPPATWDEFVEAAKKLTDPAKGQIGYNLLGMDWADWFFEYYVWQAGGDLTQLNPDGTITLTFTSEPVVTALQFYKDLKFTHKVTQKNVVQSLDDNQKDFYTGKGAMQVAASDWFGGLVSKGMNIEDIGFAPLPAGPSGKSPSQVGGNYWVLNPKSSQAQKEAAFAYASFFTSKEVFEKSLQKATESGSIPNLLNVRTDVDMTQFVAGLPADLQSGVQAATKDTHLEYALKGSLSPYVVKAIQKVLLSDKSDPLAELQAAQDSAQKEVVDKYNADLKK